MNLPYKGPYHMARGGSWVHGDAMYAPETAGTQFHIAAPYAESDIIGFRCAKAE